MFTSEQRQEIVNIIIDFLQTEDNVGIGTTGPGEKLDVVGNLSVGPVTGLASIHRGTVDGSNGIQLSGNINSTVSDTNPGAYINLGGGPLTDTFEGNVIITAYGSAIDDGNRNTIRFNNRSGVNTVSERMRITSAGNVGIGTTNPVNGVLEVVGQVYGSANCSMLSYTDRTPYPENLSVAYDAIDSVEGIDGKINKEKLHPILKDKEDRNLSMTVSVLLEVIKDLKKRIEVLEK
jgi:hypothetical protein